MNQFMQSSISIPTNPVTGTGETAADAISVETGSSATAPATPSVEYQATVAATAPTILLKDWLQRWSARLINVPANGNCFWGALYVAFVGVGRKKCLSYDRFNTKPI